MRSNRSGSLNYQRLAALLALSCIFFLALPQFFILRINQEEYPNGWEPKLRLPFGTKDRSVQAATGTDMPIVLNHEEALKLISNTGFPLDMDFEGFDNETGHHRFIVPNIVHYIRLKQVRFTYTDYLCLLSVHIHHRPDFIIIHTDVLRSGGFKGKYWNWIQNEPGLYSRIRLMNIQAPTEIFGQELSQQWRLLHGSDIARAKTMMKYGGIYLDNDIFVVHNLHKYRKYELAIGWPTDEPMGTQVLIGHRKCRFLPLWLETYREYNASSWYYNAGERPTKEVLEKRPHIVHRVERNFGTKFLLHLLYETENWNEWRDFDTIHLVFNHRWYLDKYFKSYPVFDEDNIRHYPFTFGKIARLLIDPNYKPYRIPSRSPNIHSNSSSSAELRK